LKNPWETRGFSVYNLIMKKISNSSIAYFFYALGTIDYVSANFFDNDFTGIPFSPIILSGIGSIFMYLHNSKIKESNNNVYEIFKLSLFAVLMSDDIIDESELEYSSSILNTLENEFLLPTNPSKLEQEILNYDLNDIYEKIHNLENAIPYRIKLNILSSCAILCVMDGRIDEVEQESIYKISNILNISEVDMRNIFNASIASYIDFKNSDRDKLHINDSEVKKVVDEKKAENKSNMNQIYTGMGVFAVLVIFGIYSSFQVSIEESCDNFILNYENKIIEISNKSVVTTKTMGNTVNEFYRIIKTDSYKISSYEDQLEIHNELFSNFYNNLDSLEVDLELINALNFDYSIEHNDLEQVVYLFELYNTKNKELKVEDIKYYETFLQKVQIYEQFFKDWDQSNNNVDKQKVNDIFNEKNNKINDALSELDSSINDLINEKNELQNDYKEYAEIICLDYEWGE